MTNAEMYGVLKTNFEFIFTFDSEVNLPEGETQLFANCSMTHTTREIPELRVYDLVIYALNELKTEYNRIPETIMPHLQMVSMCVSDAEESIGTREMLVRCPWLANKYSPLYNGKIIFNTHKMEGYQPDPKFFDMV